VRTILIVAVLSTLAAPGPAASQTADQVYKPGDGVTTPTVVKDVKPNYTPDAMRRRVQGLVGLSCVVRADGNVGECRVTRPLDAELDQEALRVAKQWQFKPGTKDGKPVAVEVSIDMSFTMRDKQAPRTKQGAENPPVYRPGAAGVSSPVVIREVKPNYPEDVKKEGIQGMVELEGIVQPDGTIKDIRVTKSLDARLDREAIEALTQWRFRPGQKDGTNVRVLVLVEITFSVK
jgi:TonB family protein